MQWCKTYPSFRHRLLDNEGKMPRVRVGIRRDLNESFQDPGRLSGAAAKPYHFVKSGSPQATVSAQTPVTTHQP